MDFFGLIQGSQYWCYVFVLVIQFIYNLNFFLISKLITDVNDYIEFYNYQRFHEKTNGCAPRKYKIKSEKEEGFLGCSI